MLYFLRVAISNTTNDLLEDKLGFFLGQGTVQSVHVLPEVGLHQGRHHHHMVIVGEHVHALQNIRMRKGGHDIGLLLSADNVVRCQRSPVRHFESYL